MTKRSTMKRSTTNRATSRQPSQPAEGTRTETERRLDDATPGSRLHTALTRKLAVENGDEPDMPESDAPAGDTPTTAEG